MRRDRLMRQAAMGGAMFVLLGVAPAWGQNTRDETDRTVWATPPQTRPGRAPAPTDPPPARDRDSGSSGGSAPTPGAPAARTIDAEHVRAQPATTDPRLRELLYKNVRHPGGTYSTQPLEGIQDLDKPLPQTSQAQGEAFQILGQEDFDGFTAYAVNDADLFLKSLSEEQRRLIRVVRAGEFGNPYDLILVDDSVGFSVRFRVDGGWTGAGAAYYENDSAYYTSPWAWGYGVYPLGYPSAHAARWGFPYGYGYWAPYRYSPYGYSYYDGYPRYWGPIESRYSPGYQSPGAAPLPDPPEVELTSLELAQALLTSGYVEEAIAQYRDHLKGDPEDTVAMRALGAALIEVGEISDGFAMIRLAYGSDPALAGDPLDGRLFGSARLRETLRRAVRAANKEESSSAWLAVTVLMQAQGRDDVALKNLVKAERQYLSEDIARALRQRLE